ncbi:mucin-1 [Myxocyprinus asiaticus]|uniref:mucin-1 n=1 Tax=Myxocyprinus asiaticus TaxID=70543 RepID=UPI0022239704|nr:mucin-1 [Myxocyprinus asiaticus]
MGQTGLPYTGAAFCIMLFVASSAQPITILDILQAIQEAPKNYSMPTYSFFLCMEITNRVFNDSLLNPATKDYKQMYAEVAGALNIIYNCSTCDTRDSYRGVTDMRFRKGSVIANCSISFKTIFINNIVVKNLFTVAIEKNPRPNGLEMNKQFTSETVTPVWYFPKTDAPTTPMSRTTHSAIKDLGGATARTIPSGQNDTTDTVTHYYYGIPGWAIALLVLACVILLLLIILLILLICCWCCRRKHKKEETTKLTEHAPYERTSFKEHLANPPYNPHSPQKNPNLPVFQGEPEGLNGNRPGMYVLNPTR